MNPTKKSARILLATLVCYGVLMATHLGEFWPFSIYPMFSQAGHPWSRAVVRATSADDISWGATSIEDLPGEPYALAARGVDHIDLGSFVAQTQHWDERRLASIRAMLEPTRSGEPLLIMRAEGRMTEAGTVEVTFRPEVLLSADRAVLADTTVEVGGN